MQLDLIKNKRVLYVEDEADARSQTAQILRDLFLEVFVAKDGFEALELFANNPVDLIITDILMPNMSGLDLIRSINAKAKVPTIITTAFTDTEYLLEAIRIGVDGYTLKPIDIGELVATINKALLPIAQSVEIKHYKELVETIGVLVGGKKIEVLKFIVSHLDGDGFFYGSYGDIMQNIDVSKPTVIKLFKDLIDAGVLERIKNGVYKMRV